MNRWAPSNLTALALCLMSLSSAALALEAYGVAPIHKIAPRDEPVETWQAGSISLECAGNESEAFQVVFRSAEPIEGLSVELTDLQGEGGRIISADTMRLHKVEWVDVNAPMEVDKPSENPNMRPDPLPPVKSGEDSFSIAPGENLIFWIAVYVPEGLPGGVCRGQVRLRQGGETVAALDVDLRVRAFSLPRRPTLQSMVGLASGNMYKAHGCKTDQDKEQLVRLYFDEYIRARLSPFLYAPGTMAFSPLPNAAIVWEFTKGPDGKPDGNATVDFSGFDREAARYFDELDAFSAFNFAPYLWTRREKDGKRVMVLRFADSKGAAVERLNEDGSVNPVFDELVVSVFRQIAAHLAEKGWLERAIYYVTDEPGEDDTPGIMHLCQLVRRADPRLRTSLTYDPANRPRLAELVDEEGKSLISVWIPYCSMYREDVAAQQRAKGADYWLYDVSSTCLIPHSGETNRAIMWSVWQRDAHGYLYYLSTYWGRDATPWERPSFMLPGVTYQYRLGDGYFFYPPLRRGEPEQPILDYVVPTIRWEMLREGAEDYEYLRMLQRLTELAGERDLPVAAEGEAALETARRFAEAKSMSTSSYGIRDLIFEAKGGWSCGLEEGWLLHGGGKAGDLPIVVETKLPNGRYEIVLSVYDDTDYRGKPFSRFKVDGRSYATANTGLKGPVNLRCGTVEVRDGKCGFTLSSVDEDYGVILYRVGLRTVAEGGEGDLYTVRSRVAAAIERIQALLQGQ